MANVLTTDDIDTFFYECQSAAQRGLLYLIRGGVEAAAKKYVGHGIAQDTYTEFHRREEIGGTDGSDLIEVIRDRIYADYPAPLENDGHVLQLDHGFVRSITSLYEDAGAQFGQGAGDFAAGTLLTSGTDYTLELDSSGLSKSGRVLKRYGSWSSAPGTIKVTYVAGFTAAELAADYAFVKLAVLEEMQLQYQMFKGMKTDGVGPVESETIHGEYSVKYATRHLGMAGTELSPGVRQKLYPIRRIRL